MHGELLYERQNTHGNINCAELLEAATSYISTIVTVSTILLGVLAM